MYYVSFSRSYKKKKKQLTVTGLSGNWMQKEQFNLSSNKSKTSSPCFLLRSFSSDRDFPVSSSWRFFAFSPSVREESASMARIAAMRSLEGRVGSEELNGGGRDACLGGGEQSGQSHWRVQARVSGGFDRQSTCQGVTQVLQVIVSISEGLARQSMQMPSPSQGSWETCAMGGEESARKVNYIVRTINHYKSTQTFEGWGHLTSTNTEYRYGIVIP